MSSQAVLRILGTGVAPFDDTRRAALASALQSDLSDVAAGDVAILTACRYSDLACLTCMNLVASRHTPICVLAACGLATAWCRPSSAHSACQSMQVMEECAVWAFGHRMPSPGSMHGR